MKSGYLFSSPSYSLNNYSTCHPAVLRNGVKIKDFPSGLPLNRESISCRSKRSRVRKGSSNPAKLVKTTSKMLDFTNIAYREAVGRLRFLLEDSYVPAIKPRSRYKKHCLDESEDETGYISHASDHQSLAETSKYVSKNYRIPPNNETGKTFSATYSKNVPHYSAELPTSVGAAPPEIISFIKKQEDYIEQLEKESKFCREELSSLLGKVRDVISENETLTENARSDILHHGKSSTSSESEENHYTLHSRSQREKEAKTPQYTDGPNIVFESRISELEAELAQANIDLKSLRQENAELKCKSAIGARVDSQSLDSYRQKICNLEKDNSNLNVTIRKLQQNIEELLAEGSQVATKTQRTRDLADMVIFEKSQAEAEIRRLKDEVERQHERVRELQQEMSRRIAEERSNAERRYTYHVDQLGGDLTSQWEHASKLQLELERQKRFESDLKRELAQRSAQIDELKQELKDKKATYLTDLADVNAEKLSLEQEITSLRLQLDRSQRHEKIEVGRLNAEITSLRQRLDKADAEILQARRENLRLSEDIANLEKDLALGELKGEIRPTAKEIGRTFVEMEKKHAETVSELEEMIQSQRQLMDKLTTECKSLTNKLEETSLKHKKQEKELRRTNDALLLRLKHIWLSYKENDPDWEFTMTEISGSNTMDDTGKLPLSTIHQATHTKTIEQNQPIPSRDSFHQSPNIVQTTNIHQLTILPETNTYELVPKMIETSIPTQTKITTTNQLTRNTIKAYMPTDRNLASLRVTALQPMMKNLNISDNLIQMKAAPINSTSTQAISHTKNLNTGKRFIIETTSSHIILPSSTKDLGSNMMNTIRPHMISNTNQSLIHTPGTAKNQSASHHCSINNKPQQVRVWNTLQQEPSPINQHWTTPQQCLQCQPIHQRVCSEGTVNPSTVSTSKAVVNRKKAEIVWDCHIRKLGKKDPNFCQDSLPRHLKECRRHRSVTSPLDITDIDPYNLTPHFDISSPSMFDQSSDDN